VNRIAGHDLAPPAPTGTYRVEIIPALPPQAAAEVFNRLHADGWELLHCHQVTVQAASPLTNALGQHPVQAAAGLYVIFRRRALGG
jgi:hypothetical protein